MRSSIEKKSEALPACLLAGDADGGDASTVRRVLGSGRDPAWFNQGVGRFDRWSTNHGAAEGAFR
jgi:hypothetical protein